MRFYNRDGMQFKSRRAHRLVVLAFLAAAGVGAAAESAEAQPAFRVGLTDDPDALFLGFQYGIPLAESGPGLFLFEPGVDFGIIEGPADFFIRGTFHFKYLIPIGRGDFVFYPLIGPAIFYIDFDNGDDTEVGMDFGFGFGFRQFSFELWAGFSDIPDITFSFAFHF